MSIHHSVDEEEEVGKEQEVELKFVTLEHDEGAEPICNFRALVVRCCHGNRRGYMLLFVYGFIMFTTGKTHQSVYKSYKLMTIC